jgi:hypothetical protein
LCEIVELNDKINVVSILTILETIVDAGELDLQINALSCAEKSGYKKYIFQMTVTIV